MDRVALPWMLPAGDYVLGWRWDTEESNQVWGQCADVTIKANAGAASLGSWEGVPCPLKRGPSSHLSTRPNISESHSEISTRVPHCITGAVAGRSFEYPPEHQRVP